MEVREQLPVHPLPAGAQQLAARPVLRVDGLVAHPASLTEADLAGLPRVDLAEPFACQEGWMVPGLCWQGVRLTDALKLVGPLPEALYVRVCAGEYAVPVSLEEATTAVLCNVLNGEPLAVEHGAPWRLVLPGGSCFTSVKWVDGLELTAEPGSPDGERIARARLSRTD